MFLNLSALAVAVLPVAYYQPRYFGKTSLFLFILFPSIHLAF